VERKNPSERSSTREGRFEELEEMTETASERTSDLSVEYGSEAVDEELRFFREEEEGFEEVRDGGREFGLG
jgi:hypothetical protein